MSSKHLLLLAVVVLGLLSGRSQAASQDQAHAAKATKRPAAAVRASQHEDEGDRIFQQNCSRCHNAPEGFSDRISGTIVRHMRVRASLSQHEEQQLLRFLNP
jgi:cytochrome c5